MQILKDLQGFNKDRLEIEELVSMEVLGTQLQEGFKKHSVAEPEWLAPQLEAIRREIADKRTDALLARKKRLQSQRAGLLTPDEKRKHLDEELAEIDIALSGDPTKAPVGV